MTENRRLIVDDDYSWVDTVTDCVIEVEDAFDLVNELWEENEQLKQRNINQYNQLNKLWQLIEAKDWETLTEWTIKMKESEERLQQEWKCYE